MSDLQNLTPVPAGSDAPPEARVKPTAQNYAETAVTPQQVNDARGQQSTNVTSDGNVSSNDPLRNGMPAMTIGGDVTPSGAKKPATGLDNAAAAAAAVAAGVANGVREVAGTAVEAAKSAAVGAADAMKGAATAAASALGFDAFQSTPIKPPELKTDAAKAVEPASKAAVEAAGESVAGSKSDVPASGATTPEASVANPVSPTKSGEAATTAVTPETPSPATGEVSPAVAVRNGTSEIPSINTPSASVDAPSASTSDGQGKDAPAIPSVVPLVSPEAAAAASSDTKTTVAHTDTATISETASELPKSLEASSSPTVLDTSLGANAPVVALNSPVAPATETGTGIAAADSVKVAAGTTPEKTAAPGVTSDLPKPGAPVEPSKNGAPEGESKPGAPVEQAKPGASPEPPKNGAPSEQHAPATPSDGVKAGTPTALTGEQAKPAASGEQSKPAASAEQTKPAASGEQSKPAVPGEQSKPAASADPSKPGVPGEQTKPTASGDQAKPAASAEQTKPAASGEQSNPAVSAEQTKPSASGDQAKPSASGDQAKPAVSAEQTKPAASGDQAKPAASGDQTKPAASAEQTKPAASADPSKPGVPGEQTKPAASGEQSKPAVPGEQSKPAASAEPARPATPATPGELQKLVAGGEQSKPAAGGDQTKPISGTPEGAKKETTSPNAAPAESNSLQKTVTSSGDTKPKPATAEPESGSPNSPTPTAPRVETPGAPKPATSQPGDNPEGSPTGAPIRAKGGTEGGLVPTNSTPADIAAAAALTAAKKADNAPANLNGGPDTNATAKPAEAPRVLPPATPAAPAPGQPHNSGAAIEPVARNLAKGSANTVESNALALAANNANNANNVQGALGGTAGRPSPEQARERSQSPGANPIPNATPASPLSNLANPVTNAVDKAPGPQNGPVAGGLDRTPGERGPNTNAPNVEKGAAPSLPSGRGDNAVPAASGNGHGGNNRPEGGTTPGAHGERNARPGEMPKAAAAEAGRGDASKLPDASSARPDATSPIKATGGTALDAAAATALNGRPATADGIPVAGNRAPNADASGKDTPLGTLGVAVRDTNSSAVPGAARDANSAILPGSLAGRDATNPLAGVGASRDGAPIAPTNAREVVLSGGISASVGKDGAALNQAAPQIRDGAALNPALGVVRDGAVLNQAAAQVRDGAALNSALGQIRDGAALNPVTGQVRDGSAVPVFPGAIVGRDAATVLNAIAGRDVIANTTSGVTNRDATANAAGAGLGSIAGRDIGVPGTTGAVRDGITNVAREPGARTEGVRDIASPTQRAPLAVEVGTKAPEGGSRITGEKKDIGLPLTDSPTAKIPTAVNQTVVTTFIPEGRPAKVDGAAEKGTERTTAPITNIANNIITNTLPINNQTTGTNSGASPAQPGSAIPGIPSTDPNGNAIVLQPINLPGVAIVNGVPVLVGNTAVTGNGTVVPGSGGTTIVGGVQVQQDPVTGNVIYVPTTQNFDPNQVDPTGQNNAGQTQPVNVPGHVVQTDTGVALETNQGQWINVPGAVVVETPAGNYIVASNNGIWIETQQGTFIEVTGGYVASSDNNVIVTPQGTYVETPAGEWVPAVTTNPTVPGEPSTGPDPVDGTIPGGGTWVPSQTPYDEGGSSWEPNIFGLPVTVGNDWGLSFQNGTPGLTVPNPFVSNNTDTVSPSIPVAPTPTSQVANTLVNYVSEVVSNNVQPQPQPVVTPQQPYVETEQPQLPIPRNNVVQPIEVGNQQMTWDQLIQASNPQQSTQPNQTPNQTQPSQLNDPYAQTPSSAQTPPVYNQMPDPVPYQNSFGQNQPQSNQQPQQQQPQQDPQPQQTTPDPIPSATSFGNGSQPLVGSVELSERTQSNSAETDGITSNTSVAPDNGSYGDTNTNSPILPEGRSELSFVETAQNDRGMIEANEYETRLQDDLARQRDRDDRERRELKELEARERRENEEEMLERAEKQRRLMEEHQRRVKDMLLADLATKKGQPLPLAPEMRKKYTVRTGDTLDSIAGKFFNDKHLALLIYRINKSVIPVKVEDGKSVPQLKPGLVIFLPTKNDVRVFRSNLMGSTKYDSGIKAGARAEFGVRPSAQADPARREAIEKMLGRLSKPVDDGRIRYNVRLGDTLRSISVKHPALQDITLWKLVAQTNGMSTMLDEKGAPAARLQRGTTIVLPSAAQIAEYRAAQRRERDTDAYTADQEFESVEREELTAAR